MDPQIRFHDQPINLDSPLNLCLPKPPLLGPRAPSRREALDVPEPPYSLEGLIENAMSALPTTPTPFHPPSPDKDLRFLHPHQPIHPSRDLSRSTWISTQPPFRSYTADTPNLTISFNSLDEFSSSSATSPQSSPTTPDREFAKVGAEIEEILSPVSDCTSRSSPSQIQGLQSISTLLSIPPCDIREYRKQPEPIPVPPPVPQAMPPPVPQAMPPPAPHSVPSALPPAVPSPLPPTVPSPLPAAVPSALPSTLPQAVPPTVPPVEGHAMQDLLRVMAAPSPYPPPTRRRLFSSSSTQCHLCGKTYTESSNLSKHIRTVHLKLRPFQCDRCSSSFAEKNKLRKHIQSVHERARPYKCELCSATFSQASDRKRHRLVLHEGCRPFSCDQCGKAFGRRSSLTQHYHRVHKRVKTQVVGQLSASK